MPIRLILTAFLMLFSAPLGAQTFSLPSSTPTPQPSQQVQGPVDIESGVVPVAPRVIRTAPPTPRSSVTATPAAPVPDPRPLPTPATRDLRPTVERPAPVRTVVPAPATRSGPITVETPVPPIATPIAQEPAILDRLPTPATVATERETAAEPTAGVDWRLALAASSLLALLIAALTLLHRRRTKAPPPEIERPVVGVSNSSAMLPAAKTIAIACHAEKLVRSAVFATVRYRIELHNRTGEPLRHVRVGVGLISARPGAAMEDQVASDATALEPAHVVERIGPSQRTVVTGEVKLPLASVEVIHQGRLPLLVPLLHVRIDGAGDGALTKTFVVGQGMPGSRRVQPFRLDEPPQSYAPVALSEVA